MVSIETISYFLNHFLGVERFRKEKGGIYHPLESLVKRLGLALEPQPGLEDWIRDNNLDAIFFHRPWKLDLDTLPNNVGVITYHLAFDEGLTLGFNRRLAEVLLMQNLQVFGKKEGRPIGMIGNIPETDIGDFVSYLQQVFGDLEQVEVKKDCLVNKVAVVGAMNEELITEATLEGVHLYLTGQMRKSGISKQMHLNIVAVGHHRCEQWGLKSLAGLLRDRFWGLEVIVFKAG